MPPQINPNPSYYGMVPSAPCGETIEQVHSRHGSVASTISNRYGDNENTPLRNASHVVKVDESNNADRMKNETLLPVPNYTRRLDSDSLKLLDINAFKYSDSVNSLLLDRTNSNETSTSLQNPRKSQSISLGSLGNVNRSISVLPQANASVISSSTSSRSTTPFNFTTSATPISQASSISLGDKFSNQMHYGTSMQDMSIPRTSMETPAIKGITKSRKKSYSKKERAKSVSAAASIDPKDTLEERRKYRCSVCPKGFTTSGHLARHNRIHTGEKNHACPFNNCKQRFSRQDNCLQHYRTHFKNNSVPVDN